MSFDSCSYTRWWFQICFLFTPKIGEDEPILTIFFSKVGENRQLDVISVSNVDFPHLEGRFSFACRGRPSLFPGGIPAVLGPTAANGRSPLLAFSEKSRENAVDVPLLEVDGIKG